MSAIQARMLKADCPQCGAKLEMASDELRENDGWARCGACGGVFDGFAAASVALAKASPVISASPGEPSAQPLQALEAREAPKGQDSVTATRIDHAEGSGSPQTKAVASAAEEASQSAEQIQELADWQIRAQARRQQRRLPGAEAPAAAPAPVALKGPEPVAKMDESGAGWSVRKPAPKKVEGAASKTSGWEPPRWMRGSEKDQQPAWSRWLFGRFSKSEALAEAGASPWERRQKRMAARWGALTVALAALAIGQGLWWGRQSIATERPEWRPALERACQKLGCEIGYKMAIDKVDLASADVSMLGSGVLAFRGLVRSEASFESAAPRLWLALEGANGETIASRVFDPIEWLGKPTLEAGEEAEAKVDFAPIKKQLGGYKALLVWGQPKR